MSNVLSKMPNIAIPRSRFKQEFNHSTSFQHGKLIPIDCFEILPGDNYSLTLSSLIRMSTPIAPIFGNIKAYLHAFFVPMRLIWNDAEKFYGDPSNHDTLSSITPVDPSSIVVPNWKPTTGSYGATDFNKSVTSYLGKPFCLGDGSIKADTVFLSCLKERGYYVIWNEYFRPSNLIASALVNKATQSDVTSVGSWGSENLEFFHPCMPVCKQYDYFTACTLSPQFGASVQLPLGDFAPLFALDNVYEISDQARSNFGQVKFQPTSGNFTGDHALYLNKDVFRIDSNSGTFGGSYNVGKTNLAVDLSVATAATINSIRYAFQVQKYLERSNYGSKFYEILNAHYGVSSPDGRLQRPDRLGYHKFYINVSQVLATASSTNGSEASSLGQTGAVSVTGDKVHLFDGAFTEPGYLYVLIDTKYDRSYAGGILREDKRKTRLEFYSPEFANLGDQAIYKNELALYYNFTAGSKFGDASIFGYQEHWAEYRYRKDRVSGILNPTSTAQAGVSNLAFWTLADNFDSVDNSTYSVSLNPSFLFEDREALARTLSTGSAGPDFIADFHFEYIATRELPLYSIPGLIDHFGAL